MIPSGRRRRAGYHEAGRHHRVPAIGMPFPRVSDVLWLRELALGRWLPLHRLRCAELAGWLALPTGRRRRACPLREAVLLSRGELVNDRHLDVAGSSLPLNGPVRAANRLLALARQHDTKLVAEVVFEVYQSSIWIDLLRSCLRHYAERRFITMAGGIGFLDVFNSDPPFSSSL